MATPKLVDATVLIIEGRHADFPSFTISLQKKGFDVRAVKTGTKALTLLTDVKPNILVVNAASMRSTGVRICKSIRDVAPDLPLILLLAPEKKVSEETATVILKHPFTIQKLTNRIKPLLPGEGENILAVGAIRLDLDRNRVRCLGQNTRLTPRLMILLKALMKHPGEVIEREELFKEVWDTEYTGDTRTLDVHISWLRRAIEPDPTQPKLLRTIRGVGYRLDI